MKKLISYGFVLILNLFLVFQPALILAANGPSKIPPPPSGKKVTVAPGAKRLPARTKAQVRELEGQTSTLLPDDRLLIVGGKDSEGAQTSVAINDPRTGETTAMSFSLREARAWHTATMLPDGRVLVIGGKGLEDKIVQSAELIDVGTQTSEVVPTAPYAFGRAYHTATLLTDGKVLIVGGVSARGNALNRAELWDLKTQKATTLAGKLAGPRHKQKATLQADGSVLIEGGSDSAGNEVVSNEVFDSKSLNFASTGSWPSGQDNNPP